MNTNIKIGIGILVVLLALAGALLVTQRTSATSSLTTPDANDAMANRYTAMAQFYMANAALQSNISGLNDIADLSRRTQAQALLGNLYSGKDLTTLSSMDAAEYLYQVLAYFYLTHPDAIR